VIVVLENSYPTTITWEQQHVPAILWTTHAGQETGHALADVLFGGYDPSGHLTQSWPQSQSQVADIGNYDIIKSGQTYMYSTQPALYPFGYGLSYTSFRYGDLRLSAPEMGERGQLTATVDVTNTGSRAGRDVAQLYAHQVKSRVKQPLKKLIGFQNVDLAPGQTKAVTFQIHASDLASWDVTRNKWVVERSPFQLMVGSSSADIAAQATLQANGEVIAPRDLAVPTQAQNFDDYQGVQLVDQSKASGTAVGASAGQWIKFADADLRDGPATFTAQVARASAGTAQIQIRLDDPATGPVIGTATVPSTGDVYTYTAITAALSKVHGVHDVYLVFTGDLRIASFSMR
jgi:beta-glucosidase